MVWLMFALLFWQAADPVAEGNKALDAKQYDAAISAFQRALAADAGDIQARFQLALALSGKGDAAAAEREYRDILKREPKLYQAQMNLGLLLLQRQNVGEALPLLASAAELKPDSSAARRAYGDGLLAAKQFAEALAQYNAVQQKTADVEIGLARALAGQGKLAEAAPHYQQAASLDPYFRPALLELAQLYEAKGSTAEAVSIYEQFPDEATAKERLAVIRLRQGDFSTAVPRLEEALRQAPTQANRLALATAYLKTQQPSKAAPLLEQALKEQPNDVEVRLAYGRILRDQKKYAPAAQEFYRVVQAQPTSREAWGEFAGMLILLEQYPQALAALDKVKALGQENAGYYYLRAIVLDKLQQLKPALESYQQFLAVSNGKSPDEEFKARQRSRILQREIQKH